MKISHKEKEKVMATSKAQSIINSKVNTRKGSMDISRTSSSGNMEDINNNHNNENKNRVL